VTWVFFTLLGAVGQTARNAMQRGLTPQLGALGATLVRFLFGFPFALLFLAAVLWGTVANNVLNLYTAGLGLLALRVRAPRWIAVLGVGIGASVLTYIAIFVYNFMSLYAQWLILTLAFLSPWVAILLVDFWLRRGQYDVNGLHTWGTGEYWYSNGINWRALAIYVLGIVAALAFSNSTIWASPLAVDYLGGADLSLFVGFLLTGSLYYLSERNRMQKATPRVIATGA